MQSVEKLSEHIRTQWKNYNKPENKNVQFIEQLKQQALEHPSNLWTIYAPTKKLQQEFLLVDNQALANKWLRNYQAGNGDSIQTIAELAYQACIEKGGKKHGEINPVMLSHWSNAFKDVAEFAPALEQVKEYWTKWENMSISDRIAEIEATMATGKKMKM